MTTVPVTGGQRLRVDDVLLAGETPEGPALVSIEAIILDEAGLTIMGPRAGAVRTVPWSDISDFGGFTTATMPDGTAASALLVDVRGRTLRFLLPDATVADSTLAGLGREFDAHLARTPNTPSQPLGTPPPAPGPGPAVTPAAAGPPPAAVSLPVPPPVPSAPTPAPVSAARPPAFEGPISHLPPTPHLPPTALLRPVGDQQAVLPTGPVPPRAVAVPPSTSPPPAPAPAPVEPLPDPVLASAPSVLVDAPAGDGPVAPAGPPPVSTTTRGGRRRGVRRSQVTVARPLLAADEFEFSSDPSLPRGGPAPGAVIEVSRRHPVTRRILLVLAALVVVAGVADGVYYATHHSLFGSSGPPVDVARDHQLAATTVIEPSDLAGWTALPVAGGEPFAMGATSSVTADQASANASTVLALCLRVSPATLSAATGVAGAAVPQRTVVANSRVYGDPSGDAVGSRTDVMDASSVVEADAKVFANGELFSTCYQPYVQAMLPYLSALWGGNQSFDTATVSPTSLPTPTPSGERAYEFQITLFGHSGDAGTTSTLTDVAVFGGRFQATLSMYSNLVFPVNTMTSLIGSTESRVAAVADR